MADSRDIHISKLLSLVLRHRPEHLGLALDAEGYVDVQRLLEALARHSEPVTREDLERIVGESDKQRFAFDPEGKRIRASQGHSIAVDLDYAPAPPPSVLFHGTVARNLAAIRADGLRKMQRRHVHLSSDEATAREVGKRRGKPVVLRIDAAQMHEHRHVFYLSANGVWLTEHVPPHYIEFPDE